MTPATRWAAVRTAIISFRIAFSRSTLHLGRKRWSHSPYRGRFGKPRSRHGSSRSTVLKTVAMTSLGCIESSPSDSSGSVLLHEAYPAEQVAHALQHAAVQQRDQNWDL